MSKYTVSLLVLVLFVSACAEQPEIDYFGNSYTPTTDVELFFSEDDIEEEYVEMGKAIAQASTAISTEELQDALVEEAREAGADAVLINNIDRKKTGETTTFNQNTDQEIITDVEGRKIEATFIKYKKNL